MYIIGISVVEDDMKFSSSQEPQQIYGTIESPVLWERLRFRFL